MLSGNTYNFSAMAIKAGNNDSRLLRKPTGESSDISLEQLKSQSSEIVLINDKKNKELYINSIVNIIEKRIAEGSFDFNQIAGELNISKSILQGKINYLFGTTHTKLPHSSRIEIARKLLLNKSLNIAEVAYRAGFNDPKYFSRRFKSEVGASPKEYRESMKQSQASAGTCGNEDPFLIKVLVKLEKRMSDGNLTFDQFANEMNVSKASLYRKLKSVSGLSPCEFIRSVRIKRSAQLLTKHKNVADVAFEVGFNDSKYFSRCFKNEFGLTPTQYQEQLVG